MKRLYCVVGVLALAVLVQAAVAQPQLPIFRTPFQLASTLVNTASTDYAPTLPAGGLTLYITSNRAGGAGGQDVWMFQRSFLASTVWVAGPANICAALNTALSESYIDVRDDDLEFFLSANQTGTVGANDIWVSTRTSPSAPWGAPVNVGFCNSTVNEDDPSLTGDGLELFFVTSGRAPGQGTGSIFSIRRPSRTAAWDMNVYYHPGLDSTYQDHSPSVSPDGLWMIWSSTRPGTGTSNLFLATRPDPLSTVWTTVGELTELNGPSWSHNGQWDADGFSYFYAKDSTNMIWQADRILPLCLVDGVAYFGPGRYLMQLGGKFTVSCRRDPGDVGVLVGSLGAVAPTPLPGIQGMLEVNVGLLFAPPFIGMISSLDGRHSVPFAVPNLPVLHGVSLHFQSAAQDQQSPPKAYLSNRVEVILLK
ncbi:MAG: PD40 domain-containing protein [Planctomycetes bacterium]|nr:PD40 domain-containing protein [Planctomycetota bacterium]